MVRIQLKIFFILLFCGCSKEFVDISTYQCNIDWNDESINHPKSVEFQSFLNEMTNQGLTGVMMTIQTPDGNVWTGTAGKIDIENNLDLESCNISRIGSITKTFTAVIILKLVDEGKIDLDNSINQYLSTIVTDKIDNSQDITVRNLLNHSSGIRDYTTIKGYTEFVNDPTKIFSTNEYLELNVYNRSPLFEPGTSFEYSNANYGLLAWIAEDVTGKKIGELYDEFIFAPLNLNYTTFNKNNPTPQKLARGYVDFNSDGKIFETTDWGVLIVSPAAGILSNTYDLFVFEEALHSGQLLSDSSYNEMTTLIDVPDPKFNRTKYGLGLRFWETEYGNAYGHSGGMYGYLGEAFYFPDSDVVYTLLVNCSFGICNEIVDDRLNEDVLKIIFE